MGLISTRSITYWLNSEDASGCHEHADKCTNGCRMRPDGDGGVSVTSEHISMFIRRAHAWMHGWKMESADTGKRHAVDWINQEMHSAAVSWVLKQSSLLVHTHSRPAPASTTAIPGRKTTQSLVLCSRVDLGWKNMTRAWRKYDTLQRPC